MSLLGSILQQVEGSEAVAGLAAKVGISTDQIQSVGNTLEAQIEGTGTVDPAAPAAAGATSGVMGTVSGLLDRDGDGNPLNDVLGMAKGFFGSKT